MHLIDLSHAIRPEMPLFPGTPKPRVETMASVAREGYAESWLGLASHTGTHIDAPAHLLAKGKTLGALPLDHFIGQGLVIPVKGPSIPRKALASSETSIQNVRFVMLHTGWDLRWGRPDYFEGFPILEAEAAAWLASFNLAGIGIDAPSLDPVESRSLPNHQTFLAKEICIIENLRGLGDIGPEPFLFSCLPLPFPEADGCPVRAVAMRPAP